MPVRLSDSRLSTLYKTLETQRASNASVQIDDAKVLELLAAVADGTGKTFDKALSELRAPGLSRDAQVKIVQANMTDSEKKDLGTILDAGTVPLSSSARGFLEAVLGRRGATTTGAALQVSGSQRNGIAGTVAPGSTIEAINITTAPGGRLRMDDTMVIARSDGAGKFLGSLPDVKEGDLIRLRARDASGKVGDWITIRATGISTSDTRNAVVAMQRIGLTAGTGGKVNVENINSSRQVSEPGAKLQFTNVRTGEKKVVTLNEQGSFPAGFSLNGIAGDSFSVSATDGRNNTAFTSEVGRVTVPGGAPSGVDLVKDPALHKDELNADGTPRFAKKTFKGPLFTDGVRPEDVKQGQIGNCYFPAAIAALAKSDPDALQRMIKSNGDGTYTVTFKEQDYATGRFKDVQVKVDGDLYVRSYGAPLYGSSNGDTSADRMELWYPLVEKAYAAWHGSYNDIGDGGFSSDVLQAVLGKPGRDMTVSTAPTTMDRVWNQVRKGVDSKWPVAAGTHGDTQSGLYTNSGVYADHAYSVIGYEERNGERYVQLRNPWGESEPSGNGANDGIFSLKLSDFCRLYQNLMWAEG
ncbi:MAG: hypothetical protein RL653_3670 [Pseudomonadota bacterium]|jgi:hypothetical protein